jgi:hypothetical protein
MAAAFFRAVCAGTIAAASIPSLLLTITAVSDRWRAPDALPLYVQIGIVAAVALGLVTIATLVVGIPVRMGLRRLAMESAGSYVAAGALGGVGYLWAILTLVGSNLPTELIVLPAFSGAATGYMWWRSRHGGETAAQRANESHQLKVSRRRALPPDLQVPSWPPPAVRVGDISIAPIAFVTALVVMGITIVVAVAADGRLDWLPRQDYFPPSYRTTHVQCVAERYPDMAGRTLMVDDVEAEWYPQHWRAAQEPSLYLASRSAAAKHALTYRFTWLRSFHAPVIVRLDETSDGGMRLRAKQLSGHGGYSPGKPLKALDRQLTGAEVAELRRAVAASRLFEQPQIGCLEGTDGSNWLIEANDHGQYRYLKRWTPERGPVRETGLMLLGFTGWTFDEVY